jgi:hypothetical protein
MQKRLSNYSPAMAKRIAQIQDEMAGINDMTFREPEMYGSPMVEKFAKPDFDEVPSEEGHAEHSFKLDIKAPKDQSIPKGDLMKVISDAVSQLGDFEVVGFSYQKSEKEGVKKR